MGAAVLATTLRGVLSRPSRRARTFGAWQRVSSRPLVPPLPAPTIGFASFTRSGHPSLRPSLGHCSIPIGGFGAAGSLRSLSLWPFGGRSQPSPSPQEATPSRFDEAHSFSSADAPALGAPATSETTAGLLDAASHDISRPVEAMSGPASPFSDAASTVAETLQTHSSALQQFYAAGIEHSWVGSIFSRSAEICACYMHDLTGLQWAWAIPVTVLALRLCMIPLQLYGMRAQAANLTAKPLVEAKVKEIRVFQAAGQQAAAVQAQRQLHSIAKEHNFRPFAPLSFILFNGFLAMSFFFGMKNLGEAALPGLLTEGALWFKDLTVAGPVYGLPLISVGLTLLNIETSAETGGMQPAMAAGMKWAFRGISALSLWLLSDLPSSVFLYWTTSNAFALVWGNVLRHAPDSFRSALKVPSKAQTAAARAEMQKAMPDGVGTGFMDGFKAMKGIAPESSGVGAGQVAEGERPMGFMEALQKAAEARAKARGLATTPPSSKPAKLASSPQVINPFPGGSESFVERPTVPEISMNGSLGSFEDATKRGEEFP